MDEPEYRGGCFCRAVCYQATGQARNECFLSLTYQHADRAGSEMTTIRPVPGKKDLYVIPGYDGSTTGGNVAVLVTSEGVILVDNKFPHSFERISDEVRTFRNRMQTLLDRMRLAINAGVGRDDIHNQVDTADLDWPLRPAALQALYDEVVAAQ